MTNLLNNTCNGLMMVHSVEQKSIGLKFSEQKSIGLKFSKSLTRGDVRYSCHHNSSRFTFPIFVHSWHSSVYHSLQSSHTVYILTKDNNTFA